MFVVSTIPSMVNFLNSELQFLSLNILSSVVATSRCTFTVFQFWISIKMSKVGDDFRSSTVFCDFLLLASMSPNVTDSIPPT